MLTEEWRVFKDRMSRVEQSFATELRDARNKWAHNSSFSPDDTSRALDTMERLLTAVGAAAQADQVRRIRLDHQSTVFEQETKRLVNSRTRRSRSPGKDSSRGGRFCSPTTTWLPVTSRHRNLPLTCIWSPTARVPRSMLHPVQFFRRTYLTDGLREFLPGSGGPSHWWRYEREPDR